jgi:hypothetical protein
MIVPATIFLSLTTIAGRLFIVLKVIKGTSMLAVYLMMCNNLFYALPSSIL